MNSYTEDQFNKDKDLRKQAEIKALANEDQLAENIEAMMPGEVMQILHELRVHQIELEIQNEELRRLERDGMRENTIRGLTHD